MTKIIINNNDKVENLPSTGYAVIAVPTTDNKRLSYKLISKSNLSEELVGVVIPSAIQTLTDGATITLDYLEGYNSEVVLEGNRVLEITNASNGDSGVIFVYQDGVGGRTLTLPAGSLVLGGGAGELSLSTDPDSLDIVGFIKKDDIFIFSVNLNAN